MKRSTSDFIRRWEATVASRDLNTLSLLLAEDVTFYSPAVFKPYQGRTAVTLLLGHVMKVFGDLLYTGVYGNDEDGLVMQFETSVDTPEKRFVVEGVDIFQLDEEGLVRELRVMLRPLTATQAVAQMMQASMRG